MFIAPPRVESSPLDVPVEEVRVTLTKPSLKKLSASAAEWVPAPRPSYSLGFVAGNPALGEEALRFGVARLTSPPEFLPLVDDYKEDFAEEGGAPLPEEEAITTHLALTGAPSRFVGGDLLEVLAPWRSAIRHVRVARHCEPPTWPAKLAIVFLKMKSTRAAKDLFRKLHGRAFTSFEPDVRCNFAFVDGLKWTFTEGANRTSSHFQSPTDSKSFWCVSSRASVCVVCLERLASFSSALDKEEDQEHDDKDDKGGGGGGVVAVNDGKRGHHSAAAAAQATREDDDEDEDELSADDQLFTTACDHTFHTDCLSRWRDAPCPVCRYDHAGAHGSTLATMCDQCASSRDLWVCLLCGHCGCEQEHALEHFEATKHAYAINVDHRHVWDFVGEGYVHRLVEAPELPAAASKKKATTLRTTTTLTTTTKEANASSLAALVEEEKDDADDDDDADGAEKVDYDDDQDDDDQDDEDREDLRAIRDVLVDEGDVLGGAPRSATRRRRPGPPSFSRGDKDDPRKKLYDDEEENGKGQGDDDRAYDHRKLEGLAVEYNELLRSQLAKQREIYESRIRDAQEERRVMTEKKDDAQKVAAVRRRRRGVDAKRAKLKAKIDELEQDVRFEDDLFQTIQADLVEWKAQLAKAQADLGEVEDRRDTLVPLFEKKATDLMNQLDRRADRLDDHDPGPGPVEESKSSTLGPPPGSPATHPTTRGRGLAFFGDDDDDDEEGEARLCDTEEARLCETSPSSSSSFPAAAPAPASVDDSATHHVPPPGAASASAAADKKKANKGRRAAKHRRSRAAPSSFSAEERNPPAPPDEEPLEDAAAGVAVGDEQIGG